MASFSLCNDRTKAGESFNTRLNYFSGFSVSVSSFIRNSRALSFSDRILGELYFSLLSLSKTVINDSIICELETFEKISEVRSWNSDLTFLEISGQAKVKKLVIRSIRNRSRSVCGVSN